MIPRHFYGIRNVILRIFGAKIGSRVKLFPSVKVFQPWLFEIGDDSVISWNVQIYNLDYLKIGNSSIISQNVHLCGGTHDFYSDGFELKRKRITIGGNVWIAADAFIGPGIIIGDNAIVAARAVCMKDVLINSMVGGNPAKFIKTIKRPELVRNSV